MSRVCAIVGCGPGLGGSCALKFAQKGFKIAAMNRTAASFAPTEEKLKAVNAEYSFYAMDAVDQASVTAAFAAVKAAMGPVEVLIYNVGGGGFGPTVLEIDPTAFVQSFNLSCTGALLCSQAVLPDMLASEGAGSYTVKKKGTILFSSATSAFRGTANTGQFACGKFALRALSQSIAKEYGKQGIHACHIRLDCGLDTPGNRERYPQAVEANKFGVTADIAESYYAMYEQSPLGWSNEIDIRPFQEGWTC